MPPTRLRDGLGGAELGSRGRGFPGKDTVGSTGIQRPVGGDGAHGQHRHADDEVGHHEHGQGLVQPSLPHHKTCQRAGHTRAKVRLAPSAPALALHCGARTSPGSKPQLDPLQGQVGGHSRHSNPHHQLFTYPKPQHLVNMRASFSTPRPFPSPGALWRDPASTLHCHQPRTACGRAWPTPRGSPCEGPASSWQRPCPGRGSSKCPASVAACWALPPVPCGPGSRAWRPPARGQPHHSPLWALEGAAAPPHAAPAPSTGHPRRPDPRASGHGAASSPGSLARGQGGKTGLRTHQSQLAEGRMDGAKPVPATAALSVLTHNARVCQHTALPHLCSHDPALGSPHHCQCPAVSPEKAPWAPSTRHPAPSPDSPVQGSQQS